ncbi:MAG: DUF433 domain-containing protein [Elusimicrobia bacterium]|nr:DUF433 domain-containing protein [Elusimicrobiota bacterium]
MRQPLEWRSHIAVDPQICHGQPCFKGTRIMVYLVLELLEAGVSFERVVKDYYPGLRRESIQAALHYAANLIKEREFIPYSQV